MSPPLRGLIPETRNASRTRTGNRIVDALYSEPALRGYDAEELARALRVPRHEAERAIEAVAFDATGARTAGNASLDARMSAHGRAQSPVTWREAGGFSDDAGYLTTVVNLPSGESAWSENTFVLPLGTRYALFQLSEYPADQDDPNMPCPRVLDALAWLVFGELWGELGDQDRAHAIAMWQQFLKGQPALPEDWQGDNPAIAWDDHGARLTEERRVYFWQPGDYDSGKRAYKKITPVMQLQKFDPSYPKDVPGAAGEWRVYNQWGQDLLYKRTGADKWEAGWDFGEWLVYGQGGAVISAIQKAFEIGAITVATIYGGAAGGTAIGATIGALHALQEGAIALSNGDYAGAERAWNAISQNVATFLGTAWGKQLKGEIEKGLREMGESTGLAKVVGDMSKPLGQFIAIANKANDLAVRPILQGAQALAKTFPMWTDEAIAEAKKTIPPQVRAFFDAGLSSNALDIPAWIPWYAQQAWLMGRTTNEVRKSQQLGAGSEGALPSFGITPRVAISRTALQQLEQAPPVDQSKIDKMNETCRAAQIMRDRGRPNEAAILQAQCDQLRNELAQEANQRAQMTVTAAAKTEESSPVVPLAIGLAVLRFLL